MQFQLGWRSASKTLQRFAFYIFLREQIVKRDESSGLNLGFYNASRIMTCLCYTYISPTMCHLQTRVFLSEKLSALTTDNQDFECFTFTWTENIAGWQQFDVWWVCSCQEGKKQHALLNRMWQILFDHRPLSGMAFSFCPQAVVHAGKLPYMQRCCTPFNIFNPP